MLLLINDILDVAKLEAGKLQLNKQPNDLNTIVTSAAARLKILARDKGVTLSLEVGHDLPVCECDGGKLDQVVTNLVGNALKFTPNGGTITIRTYVKHFEEGDPVMAGWVTSTNGEFVALDVEDSGVGIPAEEVPLIFDRYRRGQKRSSIETKGYRTRPHYRQASRGSSRGQDLRGVHHRQRNEIYSYNPDGKSIMDVRSLLVLSMVPGIGAARLRALVNHFGDPESALEASERELAAAEGIDRGLAKRIRTKRDFDKEVQTQLSRLNKSEAKIVTFWDKDFPENLKKIYDPPVMLFVRGEFSPSDKYSVAVVGTRNPTTYGKHVAEKFPLSFPKKVSRSFQDLRAASIRLRMPQQSVPVEGRLRCWAAAWT